MSSNAPGPSRVFVFGISGATWTVAEPLLAAGRLPNLRRLREQGCSGTLLSVMSDGDKHYRPQVAWAAVASGCLPHRNGITAFYHTADEARVPNVWDHFQSAGWSVGLFGWPLTWPPKPLDGFVIPCYHARDDATWPPELRSVTWLDRQRNAAGRGQEAGGRPRLLETAALANVLWRNGIRAATIPFLLATLGRTLTTSDPQRRALFLRHAKLEVHADLFLKLYRAHRPQLATFHTFLSDYVSHRFWRYREPATFGEPASRAQGRLGRAVDEAYIRVDQVLGRILRALEPNTVVAVVSEHGMAPEPASTEVGDWQYVIRGTKLAEFAGLAGRLVACPIARWIAYRPPPNAPMPPDAAERFRAVRVVETGLPLFNVHERGRAEVIVKFSLDRAVPRYAGGDLATLHVEADGNRAPFLAIARRGGRARSAMHAERGVFAVCGPGVRRGERLPDASVLDVTPTLLRAAGLEVPAGLDGRPIDLFERPL